MVLEESHRRTHRQTHYLDHTYIENYLNYNLQTNQQITSKQVEYITNYNVIQYNGLVSLYRAIKMTVVFYLFIIIKLLIFAI